MSAVSGEARGVWQQDDMSPDLPAERCLRDEATEVLVAGLYRGEPEDTGKGITLLLLPRHVYSRARPCRRGDGAENPGRGEYSVLDLQGAGSLCLGRSRVVARTF